MTMKSWPFPVTVVTLCVGASLGQTIYDANTFYKPMTADFDVRQRGQLFMPPCVKNLLDCWEVVRPDLLCKYGYKYRQTLESMCMDIRFQCVDFLGQVPFKTTDVTVWNYCAPTREEHNEIDRRPLATGINVYPPPK